MLGLLAFVFFVHMLITVLFSVKINSWGSKHHTDQPTLSVIIAAHNEYHHLKRLIPQLVQQHYPHFEVIIALDRSTDGSIKLLEEVEHGSIRHLEIEKVPDHWNPKKYALNEAIKHTNGDWLIFTDADCEPNSDEWLSAMAQEMAEDTEIVLGVSPYLSYSTFLSQYIRYEAFCTFFLYVSLTLFKHPYMAVGRNFALRKDVFIRNGGYKEIQSITGGDDDLFIQKARSRKVGLALGSRALVNTFPAKTVKDYLNQKTRHLAVGKYYRPLDQFLLTIYHLIHIAFYALIIAQMNRTYFIPILVIWLFIKLVSYRFVANKVGAGFNYILLPLVDILYALGIPLIGIWAKLKKDIKWKN